MKGKQSVPFLIARSTALRFNGKLEEALQDAKVAVSVDPNDPEVSARAFQYAEKVFIG